MKVGRGNSSGRGNTAGRGNGGHNKRHGRNSKQHFLMSKAWKKTPKFGIKPKEKKYITITGNTLKRYFSVEKNQTLDEIYPQFIRKKVKNLPIKFVVGHNLDLKGKKISHEYFTTKSNDKKD